MNTDCPQADSNSHAHTDGVDANALVIAISSRALFDLSESHAVYEEKGVASYANYQIEHEHEKLEKGVAFAMVKKFLALNHAHGKQVDNGNGNHNHNNRNHLQPVEVVLISRNSADTGLRIFNSIQHYQLEISRAAFTGGQSPYPYAQPFGADLFLSADPMDVQQALDSGIAAATILPSRVSDTNHDDKGNKQLKIAFDADAVLFSDEAEQIFQKDGLQVFAESEKSVADKPLASGPFKKFLAALHAIQQNYKPEDSPIRTALVTARSAPAHARVIKTLRAWNIRIDESYFLGGMDKGEFLRVFDADIFFDDQHKHCESARQHVLTGHVPHGIVNE